jgi:rubrerythrin
MTNQPSFKTIIHNPKGFEKHMKTSGFTTKQINIVYNCISKANAELEHQNEPIKITMVEEIPPIKRIGTPDTTCQRCGYIWQRRTQQPKRCPNCKSPYWNKPRRKQK